MLAMSSMSQQKTLIQPIAMTVNPNTSFWRDKKSLEGESYSPD